MRRPSRHATALDLATELARLANNIIEAEMARRRGMPFAPAVATGYAPFGPPVAAEPKSDKRAPAESEA